jgi:hypothetical protein
VSLISSWPAATRGRSRRPSCRLRAAGWHGDLLLGALRLSHEFALLAPTTRAYVRPNPPSQREPLLTDFRVSDHATVHPPRWSSTTAPLHDPSFSKIAGQPITTLEAPAGLGLWRLAPVWRCGGSVGRERPGGGRMPDRNSRRRQAPRWAPRSHPFPVSRAVRPARPSSWACRRFLSPDAEPPTCLEFDGRPSRLAVTARGTLRSRMGSRMRSRMRSRRARAPECACADPCAGCYRRAPAAPAPGRRERAPGRRLGASRGGPTARGSRRATRDPMPPPRPAAGRRFPSDRLGLAAPLPHSGPPSVTARLADAVPHPQPSTSTR